MARLILHNTLEDAAAVAASVKGPNGSQTGGTFAACKFGNGFEVDANSEYIDFTYSPGSAGCYELWFKTKFASTDTTLRYILDRNTPVNAPRFRWNGVNKWQFTVSDIAVNYDSGSFSTGAVFHLALVWDINGINGSSDTIRFYVNGVLGSQSTSAFASIVADSIRLGNNNANSLHANGIIDNLKVYDFAKIDFDDREYQYYPPSGYGQQFLHKNRTVGINKGTTYLAGNAVEVDMPQPDHYWKLNEKSGDRVIDIGTNPIDGINNGCSVDQEEGVQVYGNSGQHIEVMADGQGEFDVQEFTVGGWVKTISTTNFNTIFAYNGTTYAIALRAETSSQRVSFRWNISGSNRIMDTPAGTLQPEKWYHVMASFKNGEQRVYVNGVLVDSRNEAGTITFYSDEVYIGRDLYGVGATPSSTWMLKNVRFYKQVITPQQIQAVYEEELAEIPRDEIPQPNHQYDLDSLVITDKGKGSLILPYHHWALQETEQTAKALDGGSDPLTGTNNNTPTINQNGHSSDFRSYDFDAGSLEYIHLGTVVHTDPMSFCAWVKPASPSGDHDIYGTGATANEPLLVRITGGSFNALWKDSTSVKSVTGGTPVAGTWVHIAAIADGNYFRLYVNGVQVDSIAYSGKQADGTARISRKGTLDAEYWDGNIDSVKLFQNIALSQSEVTDVMNDSDPRRVYNGTLSATAPTLVYDEEMGNVLSFNGSSNYINCGTGAWDLGYKDEFIVSCWAKFANGDYALLSQAAGGSGPGWVLYHQAAQGLEVYLMNTWASNAAEYTVPKEDNPVNDNEWHHIMFHYPGNTDADNFRIYIDGESVPFEKTVDTLTGDFKSNSPANIGARNNTTPFFNGRVKDVRIWKAE